MRHNSRRTSQKEIIGEGAARSQIGIPNTFIRYTYAGTRALGNALLAKDGSFPSPRIMFDTIEHVCLYFVEAFIREGNRTAAEAGRQGRLSFAALAVPVNCYPIYRKLNHIDGLIEFQHVRQDIVSVTVPAAHKFKLW